MELVRSFVTRRGSSSKLPFCARIQAVQFPNKDIIELELYPLLLRLLRHGTANNDNPNSWNAQSWNTIVGGYGAAAIGSLRILTITLIIMTFFSSCIQAEVMAISLRHLSKVRVVI